MAQLLTQQAAAFLLSVSIRTIENYRRNGQLTTVKLGYRSVRVYKHEIDRMIEVEKCLKNYRQDFARSKATSGMSTTQRTAEQLEQAFGQKIRRSQKNGLRDGSRNTTR